MHAGTVGCAAVQPGFVSVALPAGAERGLLMVRGDLNIIDLLGGGSLLGWF